MSLGEGGMSSSAGVTRSGETGVVPLVDSWRDALLMMDVFDIIIFRK